MKILAVRLFFIVAIFSGGLSMCSEPPINVDPGNLKVEPVNDRVAMIPIDNCDSLVVANGEAADREDRLKKRIDSFNTALFIAQYKIRRVKYYLAIVNRKPSQAKFLRSWLTRAVK